MSASEKNEDRVFLTSAEILEEINSIAKGLGLRLAGLSEEDKHKKRTAQLIALGALWNKFLKEAAADDAARYAEIAADLGRRMDVTWAS
jgi:hypothetical protein